MQLPIRPNCSD